MNNRLFDRSNYLTRTISVFQIVGAKLVDIYYNHLYVEATKMKASGKVPTVTEGYRHAVFAFLTALDSKSKTIQKANHYEELLIGIKEYFQLYTSYNTLTLSECIDKIAREFIPDDYFQTVDKSQKRDVVRIVIMGTLRSFTKVVISQFLSIIIDNHEEPANIQALIESMVDIFLEEREIMYHKFLASASGKIDKDDVVDRKFAEKMRVEIDTLHREKSEMMSTIEKLSHEVVVRKDQLTKVLTKFRKVESNYKRIVAEYKSSQIRINDLIAHIDDLERNKKPNDIGIGESSFLTIEESDDLPAVENKLVAYPKSQIQQQQQQQQQIQQQPPIITNQILVPKQNIPKPVATKSELPSAADMDKVLKAHTKPVVKPKPVPPIMLKAASMLVSASESESESEEEIKPIRRPVAKKPEPKKIVSKVEPKKIEAKKPEPKVLPKVESESESESDSDSEKVDPIQSRLNSAIGQVRSPVKSPRSELGNAPKLSDIY
jgi:hypothetical protein